MENFFDKILEEHNIVIPEENEEVDREGLYDFYFLPSFIQINNDLDGYFSIVIDNNKEKRHEIFQKILDNIVFEEDTEHYGMDIEFIRLLKEYLNWDGMSSNQELVIEWLREFSEYYNWDIISTRCNNEYCDDYLKILEEFPDKINWDKVYRMLPERIIRKIPDKVRWDKVIYYGNVSEQLLRDFPEHVDWKKASCAKRSKEFMRDFQDRLDWGLLVRASPMTLDVLIEHEDRIDIDDLRRSVHLPHDTLVKFMRYKYKKDKKLTKYWLTYLGCV